MKYVPFLIGGALLLWAILFGVQRMDAARRGVCGEQQRILDPAEIKQAAVRHELKTFPPSVPVSLEDLGEGRSVQTWAVPANAERFASVDDFLTRLPDGAHIEQGGADGKRLSGPSALLGVEYYLVRLHYPVRFEQDGKIRSIPHESYVSVTRCGKVVTYGTPLDPLKAGVDFGVYRTSTC